MKKSEMIAKIAEKTGLSKVQAEAAMNAYTDTIIEAMKAEGKVAVAGLGTFEVKERAARVGRNPSNGEEMTIPAKKVPSFKAGKSLKDQF